MPFEIKYYRGIFSNWDFLCVWREEESNGFKFEILGFTSLEPIERIFYKINIHIRMNVVFFESEQHCIFGPKKNTYMFFGPEPTFISY